MPNVSNTGRFRISRHGFTLIELLVVISIISMLLAILLPALGKARDAARTTQCLANKRQIGTAGTAYHADFRDDFPMKFNEEHLIGNARTGVDLFPAAAIRYYLTGQWVTFTFDSSTSTTGHRYSVGNGASPHPKTMECPGLNVTDASLGGTLGGKWRNNYGFHADHRGGWTRIPDGRLRVRVSEVLRASDKVYAMDWGHGFLRLDKLGAANTGDLRGAYVPGAGAFGVTNQLSTALLRQNFNQDVETGRHNKRVNILYMDGRAATVDSQIPVEAWHKISFTSGRALYTGNTNIGTNLHQRGNIKNMFSIAGP